MKAASGFVLFMFAGLDRGSLPSKKDVSDTTKDKKGEQIGGE